MDLTGVLLEEPTALGLRYDFVTACLVLAAIRVTVKDFVRVSGAVDVLVVLARPRLSRSRSCSEQGHGCFAMLSPVEVPEQWPLRR